MGRGACQLQVKHFLFESFFFKTTLSMYDWYTKSCIFTICKLMSLERSMHLWKHHHNQGLKLLFALREGNSSSVEGMMNTNNELPGDPHRQRKLSPRLSSEVSSLWFYRDPSSWRSPRGARVPHEPMVWAHPEGVTWQYLDMCSMIEAISMLCR